MTPEQKEQRMVAYTEWQAQRNANKFVYQQEQKELFKKFQVKQRALDDVFNARLEEILHPAPVVKPAKKSKKVAA